MSEPDRLSTGDLNATFCATLVDEWIRAGVTSVVVSPGSRSTPIAVAVTDREELAVHVHHDERAAGFTALGIGLATGVPAVVVTTSGTAAVELHPAVVEAHQAGVPLLVVTADRPPELRHVGAPQTVDQNRLFGESVRWFVDPGAPSIDMEGAWRSLAARMVVEAVGSPAGPGPVHVNLPLREPLLGRAVPLPAGRADGGPWHAISAAKASIDAELLEWFDGQAPDRPLLVAGAGCGDVDTILTFADASGWPVVADPRSGLRTGHPAVVTTADVLLRDPGLAERLQPDLVVRLGAPAASKVLGEWLAGLSVPQVAVDAHGRWFDSHRTATRVVTAVPSDLMRALAVVTESPADGTWTQRWRSLEAQATTAMQRHMVEQGATTVTEPGVARTVVQVLAGIGSVVGPSASDAGRRGGATDPAEPDARPATLVVSSSMPVRDVEWYGGSTGSVRVLANRGANGIDGVVSTAVGVALAAGSGEHTVALVGDVAFLHDTNALLGLARRHVDLTVVVVDNDGGGIFSFLAPRQALPLDRFELLFGTPHGVDLAGLVSAHGVPVKVMEASDGLPVLQATLVEALARGGTEVLVARTDRASNVEAHDALHSAIHRAVAEPAS